MALSSVDFPAPFEPISPTTSPGTGPEVDVVHRHQAAEGHREVDRPQHRTVVVGPPLADGDGPGQRRGWFDRWLRRRRRQALLEEAQRLVSEPVPDLGEPTGDVQQDDQQPDARGEQGDEVVVGPEGGQPDDPQGADHRAGPAAEAADDGHGHQGQGVVDGEEALGVADGHDQAAQDGAAQSGDESARRRRR